MEEVLKKSSLLDIDDHCNLLRKILRFETLDTSTCKILIDLVKESHVLSLDDKTTEQYSRLSKLHNAILLEKVLPQTKRIIDINTKEINSNGYLNTELTLPISKDERDVWHKSKNGLLLLAQHLSSLNVLLVTSLVNDRSESSDCSLAPESDSYHKKVCNRNLLETDICPSVTTIDGILDTVKDLLNDIAHIISNLKFDNIVKKDQHENIKIISLVLSKFMGSYWCWKQNALSSVFETLVEVTLNLLSRSQDDDISAILITFILKPSLENGIHRSNNLLNKLWTSVKTFYVIEEQSVTEKNSTGYLIICFMASYIFVEENIYMVEDEDFWKVIQHGLTHTNPLTRKRSQYILKRGVDHYLHLLPNANLSSYFLNVGITKKDALNSLWYDFFLLAEALEEKQAHVIWPLCNKLDNLICASNKSLIHISWVLAIFKRFFNHDNKNVKRWAIEQILTSEFPQEILNDGVLSFIFHKVLAALGDYTLYGRDSGQSQGTISTIGNQLAVFLQSITNSLDHDSKSYFVRNFLANVFDGRTWGGIPLFYIIEGMNKLPKVRVLSYQEVRNALVIFETCLNAQDPTIRSISQCNFINFIFNTLHEDVTLLEICDLLRHFNRLESWCLGSWFWDKIKDEFTFPETSQEINSVQKALEETLLPRSMSCNFSNHENIAIGICIIMRCLDIDKENVHDIKIFQPICIFLQDCHIRPYVDKEKIKWVIKVIFTIMEICNDSRRSINSKSISDISFEKELKMLDCLHSSLTCVSLFFINDVRTYSEPYDYQNLMLYLKLFEQCSSITGLNNVMTAHLNDIMNIANVLITSNDHLKIKFGILLTENIFTNFYEDLVYEDKILIKDLVKDKVLKNIVSLTQQRYIDGYDRCEFTKVLLLKTGESCWNCCLNLLKKLKNICPLNSKSNEDEIVSFVLEPLPEALCTAGRTTIVPIFTIAQLLTTTLLQKNLWENIITIMWETSKTFRRSDCYNNLISCFTAMLFHREVLINENLHKFVASTSQKILAMGENIQGLVKILARSLIHTLTCSPEVKEALGDVFLQEIIVPIFMCGNVFRKQDKISMDVLSYIRTYTTRKYDNSFEADTEARVYMFYFILCLKANCHTDQILSQIWSKSIIQQYTQLSGESKACDFANSQIHRCKVRLLQATLLLIPLLDENSCNECIVWLSKCLIHENQQPSLRYLQEWALSLCVILHPTLYGTLYCLFQEGISDRIGCVGSFLASLTHIATTRGSEDMVSKIIQHTLPWCMSQQFNTRLYAQVCLRKIWQHCKDYALNTVLERFGPVQDCLQSVEQKCSGTINQKNMLNDFYFQIFHPMEHFSVETILYDLPRLSAMIDEEWLSVTYIENIVAQEILSLSHIQTYQSPWRDSLQQHSRLDIALYSSNASLSNSEPAPWVLKAVGGEVDSQVNCIKSEDTNFVQRKITPWKSMLPELLSLVDIPKDESKNEDRSGLVVVASLVDKPANLGGLCRTCEIFSVREFVIPSSTNLDDHIFKTLSVTAEKWQPIREVKREDLMSYLGKMRNAGYIIVGVEQADNSIKLSEFTFPENTLLLLGNEHEGIPCELLQMMDVCIEIPQTGVIRSLNVHVSGALFVWEYVRQQMEKSAKSKL